MFFSRIGSPPTSDVQVSQTKIFPAPRRGLIQNDSLAVPQGEGAEVMDNWFPTPQGARMRRGSTKRADVGSEDIRTFMSYETGGAKKLFAATPTGIFDVTTPPDPETELSPVVSGLSSGKWSSVMFSNSAGSSSLIAVNGSDPMKRYDGTTWTDIIDTSTLGITGVQTYRLSAVWAYQNRLFFVEGGTMSAWYLPTLSYGGAAKELPMGSTFTKGGALLFGGTWLPSFAGGTKFSLVANAKTGAWCRYTGWDARCAIVFDDKLYFGTSDGQVIQGETGGSECGLPYAAAVLPRFDNMGSPASKSAVHARCVMRSNNKFEPIMFANADYQVDIPNAGISYGDASGNVWGGAIWGESTWGQAESKKYLSQWQSVAANGEALSAGVVVTSGRVSPPELELIAVHMLYEPGSVI